MRGGKRAQADWVSGCEDTQKTSETIILAASCIMLTETGKAGEMDFCTC